MNTELCSNLYLTYCCVLKSFSAANSDKISMYDVSCRLLALNQSKCVEDSPEYT